MTTHTVTRHWRRTVQGAAVGAVSAGLVFGLGTQAALAEPGSTEPATPTASASAKPSASANSDVPQFTSPDQLLAFIDQEYNMGAGGGQLSKMIKAVMQLRAMGYRPSKANVAAIIDALDDRPNQRPLLEALGETLDYQQRIKAQNEMLQQAQAAKNSNSAAMGAGQMPSDGNPAAVAPWPGGAAPVAPAAPAAPAAPPSP